tara:strand:- start:11195 stop:11626 length:432 start_codon:yes stop_codon:yes gene_type:complete
MQFGQVWVTANFDTAPVRVEETARTLRLYDTDILLLQEVEKAGPNVKQSNPPKYYTYLKEALQGYESVLDYPTEDSRELPFGVGLVIFSRYPILSSRTTQLPGAPVEFKFDGSKTPTNRIIITAEIEIEGTPYTVIPFRRILY